MSTKGTSGTLLKLIFLACSLLIIIAIKYFGLNLNSFTADKFVGKTSIYNNADISLGKDFHLNIASVLLPHSRGYGDLYSWQAAMTLDPALLKMAQDMVATAPQDIYLINDKFQNFLFRWAKVEEATEKDVYNYVAPNVYFDPRKVAFMQKISGLNFINANKESIAAAQKSWDTYFNSFIFRFLVQGPLHKIFPKSHYDFKRDILHINNTLDEIITNIQSLSSSMDSDSFRNYVNYMHNMIKSNKSSFSDPDFDKKIDAMLPITDN